MPRTANLALRVISVELCMVVSWTPSDAVDRSRFATGVSSYPDVDDVKELSNGFMVGFEAGSDREVAQHVSTLFRELAGPGATVSYSVDSLDPGLVEDLMEETLDLVDWDF